jgi:hypothetical protein
MFKGAYYHHHLIVGLVAGGQADVPWPMFKGVWKQRKSCIFDGAQPSISHTMASIKAEVLDWARAGALGLKTILLTTSDVH